MKTTVSPVALSPFRAELSRNVSAFIAQAKREGTIGMSLANLRQCVKTPSPSLEGAPVETNAQWAYANMFAEVAPLAKGARGFVRAY